MADSPRPDAAQLTHVLKAASAGDRKAAAELLPLVYDELRRLARARMARQPAGSTFQPTALVHEAYLKLVGQADPGWDSRAHFFGAAAQAIRHILVDQARRKASAKRGGDFHRVEEFDLPIEPPPVDMLALNEALTELERQDGRKARIVMLHYFGGLTLEETAEAMGMSVSTVQRQWRFTRSLLIQSLSDQTKPK
jgi:RNA polymerase sigma factor (TIGR02999 family)